jgi:Uma2 family endonuclease
MGMATAQGDTGQSPLILDTRPVFEMNNGAQLGWLLDTPNRRVCIYRPGKGVECIEDPATLAGDPELPGFVLDLTKIWTPDF